MKFPAPKLIRVVFRYMTFSLSFSLSLPLSLLSPAGIPLTVDDAVSIFHFDRAQIVCDGSEDSVSGCAISKLPMSILAQARVRCFQQTGTFVILYADAAYNILSNNIGAAKNNYRSRRRPQLEPKNS